ncbi:MAG TPA: hypothetical protein QGH10_26035 [Armatimonadota bacterium]|jgi:hypothetical protein|nr:hypothetical protein [Armatimonadota bacterium]
MNEIAGILDGSLYRIVDVVAQAHLVALAALVAMGMLAAFMRPARVPPA